MHTSVKLNFPNGTKSFTSLFRNTMKDNCTEAGSTVNMVD
jgi:hypothetical protein